MSSFSQPLTRRRDASASLVVLIVSAGFALATLDLFVVNVALGTHSGAHAILDAVDHSWLVIGAFAAATTLASVAILGIRRPAPYSAPTGATVPIDRRVALVQET